MGLLWIGSSVIHIQTRCDVLGVPGTLETQLLDHQPGHDLGFAPDLQGDLWREEFLWSNWGLFTISRSR